VSSESIKINQICGTTLEVVGSDEQASYNVVMGSKWTEREKEKKSKRKERGK
jgi:hypothetical protein